MEGPVIRGTRIWVSRILDLLAAGKSVEIILEHYDYISKEDILARISHQIRYEALQNPSDARSGSPFFEACFSTR